ncbi:MAG: energy transducer TonB [Bdellovibrionales bacterium]
MTISEERKPLAYSLGLHLFIVLVALIRPYFSADTKHFERAIKVDIVAMPDKHQKIVKKVEEKVVKKEKKKPSKKVKKQQAKVNPKGVSKSKTAVAKKEEVVDEGLEEDAFAKLARMQEEKNIEIEKQKEIAGNRVSKGTDLTGVEKIEYSNYRSTLHTAISSEWDVPKWLLEGDLSAVAHIKIDESGNLIYKKIVKSSGNSIYDEKVMEAIEDAVPFSPPPEKFKKIVYYEGVELSFPR